MKKSLFAMLCMLFSMTITPIAYAEDLPEISGDDNSAQLPPLVDPATEAEAQ